MVHCVYGANGDDIGGKTDWRWIPLQFIKRKREIVSVGVLSISLTGYNRMIFFSTLLYYLALAQEVKYLD